MQIIKNRTCRMCSSKSFFNVINFGKHPLVNSLIDKKELNKKDPIYPIVVKQCRSCKLVQLVNIIDANEIYKKVDYLYFSSDILFFPYFPTVFPTICFNYFPSIFTYFQLF